MTAQAVSVAQPIVPGFSSMMAPIYTAPVAQGVIAGGAVAPYPTPMVQPLAAGPTMLPSPVRKRGKRGRGLSHGCRGSRCERLAAAPCRIP
jgi:hypothetical protein